ncbi:MAG TPA: ATP-dependent Clp protease adaptor ClpS [Luteibaculaceae bacterium]|nr:ATP-dependent Clp protease adaptor ClpS [Luteibaculaceae bacterium]
MSWQTQVENEVLEVLEHSDLMDLVLYNDDVNTFDFVIACLVELCEHDLIQAEQCAMLVHFKGKCGVKRGAPDALKPICEALLERGLSAKIE